MKNLKPYQLVNDMTDALIIEYAYDYSQGRKYALSDLKERLAIASDAKDMVAFTRGALVSIKAHRPVSEKLQTKFDAAWQFFLSLPH